MLKAGMVRHIPAFFIPISFIGYMDFPTYLRQKLASPMRYVYVADGIHIWYR